MEADYTRKTMEVADLRRDYEGVDQTMKAFEPMIQQTGITKGEMIRRWAAAESHLNTQPIQAIKTLAAHYNVDLAALAENGEAQFNDTPGYNAGQITPEVQSLQTQVNNLETHNNQIAVDSFANKLDDKGGQAHPYFDELIPDIMNAMQSANAMGRYPDLSELYEQACWTNTSVREKMITAQTSSPTSPSTEQKAQADKVANEARQKAAKAKNASKSVSGDAGSAVEPKPVYNTVEEAAKAAYDKHST